jgi:ribonuclease BN (tRNA processing enzyme)
MGPLGSSIHPPKIDAVLISHFHPDHFFDLSGLYVQLKYHPEFGSHYSGVAPLLPVFGPSDVAQVLREVIEGDDDGGVFSPHPYPVETPFQIGPFTVTVTMAYHVIESYSLRITGPSSQKLGETAVLAYTGDTDYCPALVSLTQGADLFLAEAAFMECRDSASPRGLHLTGRQAGQVAREAQVQRLALTHIPPWGDPKVAESEAKQEFAGEITVAKPHVVYTI